MAEQHLTLLFEMLELLEKYAAVVTRQQIEADREAWLKVKGALEVAAQCAIDLALAIIAARGLGVPQNYREAFNSLARSTSRSFARVSRAPGREPINSVFMATSIT